jgi:hypothetical protein
MSKTPTEIAQLINAGVTAAMNEAGAAVGCADLAWCLDASWSTLILSGSAVGMYSDGTVPDVLKAWGRLLRLDPVTSPTVKGTRQLKTQGKGLTVTVSGVVDTPAYLADAEEFAAAQDWPDGESDGLMSPANVDPNGTMIVTDDPADERGFDDVTADAPGDGYATTSGGDGDTSGAGSDEH